METVSREQLPKFETRSLSLRVNFDEQVVMNTSEDGEPYTSYKYVTAEFSKTATYKERVEAIVQTKYGTYGAELAAKNGTVQEVFDYSKHVALAKHLAKGSLGQDVGEFSYVPTSISVRQARQQLIVMGLTGQVEAIIDGTVDVTEKAVLRNYWEYSQVFERTSPVLVQLGQGLGLTDAELDNLFYEAAQL